MFKESPLEAKVFNRGQLYRPATKPAEPIHVRLRRKYVERYQADCKHPELAECFFKFLATEKFQQCEYLGSDNEYKLLNDFGHWVRFAPTTKAVAADRRSVAKMYLELKGGGWGYHLWGELMDALRPSIAGVANLSVYRDRALFTADLLLTGGERIHFTIRKPAETRSVTGVLDDYEGDYDE